MSETPFLQLLGALFGTIAHFSRKRLPHLEIHQSTSGNQNQHLHGTSTQGKGFDLPSVRLRIPHYVPQPFVAGLNA
jgi:hypothetical protein